LATANVVVANPNTLLGGLALGRLGVFDLAPLLGHLLAFLLGDVVAPLFGDIVALPDLIDEAVLLGHLLAVPVLLGLVSGLLDRLALGVGQLLAGAGVVLPLLVAVGVSLPVLLALADVCCSADVLGVRLGHIPYQVLTHLVKYRLTLLLGYGLALAVLVVIAHPTVHGAAFVVCVGCANVLLVLNLFDGMDSLELKSAAVR